MNDDQQRLLRELADRQQILDCIHRYCRGVDRFDGDIVLSVYHPDAIDDHGAFVGGREDFVDRAFAYHREHQLSHHHMVFNHSVELEGDTAHSETYWLFFGENRSKPNTLAVGRYLDRFEKRQGRWAIAVRVCVNELTETVLPEAYRRVLMGNAESSRARSDRSYDRPLQPRLVRS